MTVKELIEILKKFPEHYTVMARDEIWYYDVETTDVYPVHPEAVILDCE